MENVTPTPPTPFTRLVGLLGSLMPVGLIAFILAALVGIFQLGMVFKLGWLYSSFVALGSIALVLGHAGSIQNSKANVQRLLHGLGLLVWIVLILFFVVLFFGLTSVGVTADMDETTITAKLAESFLSAELLNTGRQTYSYAVAIGLLTGLSATVVSYAMSHPLADKLHTTLGASFAPMAINIVTGLIVLTSALHLLNFGLDFAGVGAFESIAACVVAELTFIASEQYCLKEIKAREKDEVFDKFDLGAWAVLAVAAMAYMILINKTYGAMAEVMTLYPTDHAAGLKAAHAATNTGLLGFGKGLYSISAPIFGGLLIGLKIVTTLVSVQGKRKSSGLDQITVSRPRTERLAKDANNGSPQIEKTGKGTPPLTAKRPDMKRLRQAPRTDKDKTCAHCGETFKAFRADARYCSTTCRQNAFKARQN